MIPSKRVQKFSAILIKKMFAYLLNIEIDDQTADSLSQIGLPSEVYHLYLKKNKRLYDINKTLLSLRMESIKKLNKIKFKNNSILHTNPFKYYYYRFIQSKKEYTRIKKKIYQEFENASKIIESEKKTIVDIQNLMDNKVENFNLNLFISSIQSLNNEIYQYAKSNPQRAEHLAKLLNNEFKMLEKIYIK